MLCEQCKEREATITIREVIHGKTTEHHLCSQCAAESEFSMLLDSDNPFAKLLSGILGLNTEESDVRSQQEYALECPNCKTKFGDFIQSGRFGCAECYDTFSILMHDNIKRIQGSDQHIGKKPKYAGGCMEHVRYVEEDKKEQSLEEQIIILQEKQKEAVLDEDYEAAAYYRDEIKKLKEGAGKE